MSTCIVCNREFEQTRINITRGQPRKTCSQRCLSKLQAVRVRQSGYYASMTVVGRCYAEWHRCDGGGPGTYAQYENAKPMTEQRRWRTIVVDPPWMFDDQLRHWLYRADREGRHRGAAANYVCQSIADIAAMPIGEYAEAENAHMYLWTTNTFMVEAHRLMDGWGFRQKTILTWIKPRLGMGTYYRNCTEHVLFGVRPKSPVLRKDCRTAFYGEQGRHSEKPQAFYDMVESMSPGPYLDVFARKQRLGWDVAGNEVYSAIPELAAK